MIGLPGCGKTTAARCYIRLRQLWKHQNPDFQWDIGGFNEYNTSDYRGIDFVREKIERLTKLTCETIAYMKEADNMTDDAKKALRSPLEDKGNAIFILDGNDESGFTEAIKSRCLILRFKPLSTTEVANQLFYILKAEGMQVNAKIEDALKELAVQSRGDMRG
jgi:DNA polymerase III delta prime subunit